MARILYADNDYADIELERALFAGAGVDIVVGQCKTEDEGCDKKSWPSLGYFLDIARNRDRLSYRRALRRLILSLGGRLVPSNLPNETIALFG